MLNDSSHPRNDPNCEQKLELSPEKLFAAYELTAKVEQGQSVSNELNKMSMNERAAVANEMAYINAKHRTADPHLPKLNLEFEPDSSPNQILRNMTVDMDPTALIFKEKQDVYDRTTNDIFGNITTYNEQHTTQDEIRSSLRSPALNQKEQELAQDLHFKIINGENVSKELNGLDSVERARIALEIERLNKDIRLTDKTCPEIEVTFGTPFNPKDDLMRRFDSNEPLQDIKVKMDPNAFIFKDKRDVYNRPMEGLSVIDDEPQVKRTRINKSAWDAY